MSNIEYLKAVLLKNGISDEESLSRYDFTTSAKSRAYNEQTDLERFFTYILKSKNSWIMNDDGRITYENAFWKRSHLCYNNVLEDIIEHPDSNSVLLRDIYKCLWNAEYLELCIDKKKNIICGETMNSVNITLKELVSNDNYEKDLFKKMNPSRRQKSSITYIINRYYDLYDKKLSESLNSNKELRDFLNTYHTLGNFIPFPVECNAPRAKGGTIDYWDLTLLHIYKYYHNDDSALKKIYKDSNVIERFKKWLHIFGNWDTFIEKNYMSAFVKNNNEGEKEKYGEPIVMWNGHFSGNVLPKDNQCNEYFAKATECIEKRGIEMAKELFKRLKNQ